jgi:putative DNA primase/helicase
LKIRDDERKSDGIDVHCFAGCDWKDIKAEFVAMGLLPTFEGKRNEPLRLPRTVASPGAIVPEEISAATRIANIWRTAVPLPGTLGERYFIEVRGLPISGDLSHALRWHPDLKAIVALMTDAISGETVGLHRTFLEPNGSKRDRKMLGHRGVVRVSPDEDVTMGLGLAEGVEDALAVLCSAWAPVWAATCASGMQEFPVLSGIEALTLFHDNDAAGLEAAQQCAERWTRSGREVFLHGIKRPERDLSDRPEGAIGPGELHQV